MARLVLNWLGQIRVALDSEPVDLGYSKVRALLAYLTIELHQAHSRDELAVLLWPDSSQQAARKSLRQALTTLRNAIRDEESVPPFLLISREAIQFNPASDFYSDAGEFAVLIDQCALHKQVHIEPCIDCQERLSRGIAVYQGELLKNLTLSDSLPFEEWLLLTRERLRLQAIDALGRLMLASERSADDDAAMQYSRRRLVIDPWNEDAYRALMRILARRGQRTTALAEFERCKRVLVEELGITPSAETLALYESIRTEVKPLDKPALPVPNSLIGAVPLPLTGLIGREKETNAMVQLLQRDSVRLVTLLGSPGVGKSRLALHVAGIFAAAPETRVFYVPLNTVTNPALVITTIAQTLGLQDGSRLAMFDQLVNVLNAPGCLLILDTFEQVQAAVSQLARLLQACPFLKVLVTARAPLHLRGEQRFLLNPLSLPNPRCMSDLAQAAANPCIQLFVERVQASLPEFILTANNAQEVAEICARLDGLPLAIELAASSIRLMPPQQLLERLNQPAGAALPHLKATVQDGDPHHHTLWQAFQWSYVLLNPVAQRMFARLGVFAGGWTLEAADAVCNVGDIQPGSMDEMTELLDNCLIRQEEVGRGYYRFTILNTLREFALDRLRESGEWNILQQRHADYFLTFAKLAEPELTGRGQIAALERVELERDNLRKALDWTMTASPDQALQLASALFPFWHIRSHHQEGRHYLEQALAHNLTPSGARARALAVTGLLAQRQGDYGRAETLIVESVQLYRQMDEPAGLAYALNNLAIVLESIGDNARAQTLADESLLISEKQADSLGIARAEMISGQIALNEDRLPVARQLLGASLTYWQKTGDQKNAILCQVNLGRVEMTLGNDVGAFTLFEDSLKLSRAIKDGQWEMIALWNLAEIHLWQGQPEIAAPLLAASLEQSRALGDRFFEAVTLNRLGLIAIAQVQFIEANRLLNESRSLGEAIGSKWVVADAMASLGYAALRSGAYEQAEKELSRSLVLFNAQGERSNLALTLERLAQVAIQRGNYAVAAGVLAGTQTWRTASREPLAPCFSSEQDRAIIDGRQVLGEALWQAAWSTGQSLTLEELVKSVLSGSG